MVNLQQEEFVYKNTLMLDFVWLSAPSFGVVCETLSVLNPFHSVERNQNVVDDIVY